MNQNIYWAGITSAASDALGIHLGTSGMLSKLLREAGNPVRKTEFKRSWREDWGDGYLKPASVRVFICALRKALSDVGLGGVVKTWRSDHAEDNGAYYIAAADAKVIIKWIEGQASC